MESPQLPPEMFLYITRFLDIPDIVSLSGVNRCIYMI